MSNCPSVLCSSDEFGDFTLIVDRLTFDREIKNAIEAGFDEDFNPEPQEWELLDEQTGIYATTYCSTADGKHRFSTVKAQMTWNASSGSYRAEEV